MRKSRDQGLIGRVILEWRERRDFTQEELAAKACLSVSSIGAYERGERRPSRELLARICVALNVDPETLLVEVARAEADALKPLIEKVRKEDGQAERQRQPYGTSEPSDLFLLAARVSLSSGNPGVLDTLVRLISKVNLSVPIAEPKLDQG